MDTGPAWQRVDQSLDRDRVEAVLRLLDSKNSAVLVALLQSRVGDGDDLANTSAHAVQFAIILTVDVQPEVSRGVAETHLVAHFLSEHVPEDALEGLSPVLDPSSASRTSAAGLYEAEQVVVG